MSRHRGGNNRSIDPVFFCYCFLFFFVSFLPVSTAKPVADSTRAGAKPDPSDKKGGTYLGIGLNVELNLLACKSPDPVRTK